MTLRITSINSAQYNENGIAIFNVDCGDILSVETRIFNRPNDMYNDNLLKEWLRTNTPTPYVAPPTPDPVDPKVAMRIERTERFRTTLDIMNPVWFNSLTAAQQTNLATWRTAWLDYPETGIKPSDSLLDGIFS